MAMFDITTMTDGQTMSVNGMKYQYDGTNKIMKKIGAAVSIPDMFDVIETGGTIPVPTIADMGKIVYETDTGSFYQCVANTNTPTSDADCYWVQLA